MTMRIATAAWADPDEVEARYPYHDGTVWLGRSGSDGRMPLGYLDDPHCRLVGDESARAMVKGLILHVLTSPQYEGRRNLVTLRKLITRGDWENAEILRDAGEKDIPPAHGLLWTGLSNNKAFDGLIAGAGDSFTNRSEERR